jgi:hypothetical protein
VVVAQEIAAYYVVSANNIDLNTFLHWLSWKELIGGGSDLIDVIHQILSSSDMTRKLFCTTILQTNREGIADGLSDNTENLSSEVRARCYTVLQECLDEDFSISYADFQPFIPLLDYVEFDDLCDLLPRYIKLGVSDIELLMSIVGDHRDLLRLYAKIPSFEKMKMHTPFFNR